jgi:hypothetical protein
MPLHVREKGLGLFVNMIFTVNLPKTRYTLIRLHRMSATCMCCALSFVSLSRAPFRRAILHPKASVHFKFHQNPRFIIFLHRFHTDLILNGPLKEKSPSAFTHNKHSAYSWFRLCNITYLATGSEKPQSRRPSIVC